jgi:hypothetical protein
MRRLENPDGQVAEGTREGILHSYPCHSEDRKLFKNAAKASKHKTLAGWIRYALREAASR